MEAGYKFNNLYRVEKFIFFDGVKNFSVYRSYDGWLTSLDFESYNKSFAKVEGHILKIFSKKAHRLISGEFFSEQIIKSISDEFNLVVRNRNNKLECSSKGHLSEEFYILEDLGYYLIYSLGGSKSVESIYIHGLWKNNR